MWRLLSQLFPKDSELESYIGPRSMDPRTIFFWAWDPNAWSNQLRYNYDEKGKKYFNL